MQNNPFIVLDNDTYQYQVIFNIYSLWNIALLQVLEIMGSLPETVKQMTGVDITGRIQAVHWNVSKYKNKEYRIYIFIYNIVIAL